MKEIKRGRGLRIMVIIGVFFNYFFNLIILFLVLKVCVFGGGAFNNLTVAPSTIYVYLPIQNVFKTVISLF